MRHLAKGNWLSVRNLLSFLPNAPVLYVRCDKNRYAHRFRESAGLDFEWTFEERVCFLTTDDNASADAFLAAKSVRVWEGIIRMRSLARSSNALLETDRSYSLHIRIYGTFTLITNHIFSPSVAWTRSVGFLCVKWIFQLVSFVDFILQASLYFVSYIDFIFFPCLWYLSRINVIFTFSSSLHHFFYIAQAT